MSLSRHAYRHTAALHQQPIDHCHIWITDDLLARTFGQFLARRRITSTSTPAVTRTRRNTHTRTHWQTDISHQKQQRRYGSSIPGPLEARRRLAKRRNNDLASAGGGGGLDAGALAMLFGKGKDGGMGREKLLGGEGLGMGMGIGMGDGGKFFWGVVKG